MASQQSGARRYYSDELLRMRQSLPMVSCPIKSLNKHPDIASIFRLPDQAMKDPEHFSCSSRALQDTTNRQKSNAFSRNHIDESSGDSGYTTLSGSRTNDPQQAKWSYRRRDSSGRSSTPYQAPSTAAAQKSENFQRFYRAVISPTHVRVTAGGRIVPNNRAVAPPLFDLDSGKGNMRPRSIGGENNSSNFRSNSWQHNGAFHTGYPPFIPGPFLPPYVSLPHPSPVVTALSPQTQSVTSPVERTTMEKGDALNATEEPTKSGLQAGALPQPIKISPPAQFDQTKPFMYNGQLVYPMPPPNSVTMIGNPNCQPQGPPPGFLPQFQGHNMLNPFMYPMAPQMMSPNMVQPLENMAHMPQLVPMPGLYPPSTEALKSQIQHLSSNIKAIEFQLANNKHQVDTAFMEHHRTSLMHQVKFMESMLEFQLAYENNTENMLHEDERAGNWGAIVPWRPISSMDGQVEDVTALLSAASSADSPRGRESGQPEQTQFLKLPDEIARIKRSQPTSKSRLTLAAAMAPPFQPRAKTEEIKGTQAQLADQWKRSTSSSSIDYLLSTEDQAKIEARLMASSTSDWKSTSVLPSSATVPFSRAQSLHQPATPSQGGGYPSTIQRASTLGAPPAIATPGASRLPLQSVPYLVGTLPRGISPDMVHASDFIYPRPLTSDELRAREVYWGNTVRGAQKGLPKFDGKDFYPPSPAKGNVQFASRRGSNASFPALGDSAIPSQDLTKPLGQTTPNKPANSGFGLVQPALAHEGTKFPAYGSADSPFHLGVASLPQVLESSDREQVLRAASEGFSSSFSLRGVSDNPSPTRQSTNTNKTIVMTFGNPEQGLYELPAEPLRSSVPKKDSSKRNEIRTSHTSTQKAISEDVQSNSSTVELRFSPHAKEFNERVENFRSAESQTLFLQNMLRGVDQSPMVGTALSGTISPTTAQGYLPPYRGSAAASLAPSILDVMSAERDLENSGTKVGVDKNAVGSSARFNVAGDLAENRPYGQRATAATSESLGAEDYMRYLARKDADNKKLRGQGRFVDNNGAGPVVTSDW